MTVRHASRRLLVGGTSAALLLGAVGFIPLLTAASAACAPTYADPAGDAVYPGPLGADDDLDILDVTHTVDAGIFTSVVHVKALTDYTASFATMDKFTVNFTVNGKAVVLTAARQAPFSPLPVPPAAEQTSMSVAGAKTTTPMTMKADLKASTVSISVKVGDFEKDLGGSLGGKAFTAMSASSAAVYGAQFNGIAQTLDTATATASAAYAFGASCSGGGAPAATPSGSATPSPTPSGSATPTPSGSATPTPSGSASPSPSPTAGPEGLFLLPRKSCATYTDEAGDADPSGTGQNPQPQLDVLQVNLRSLSDSLQVLVRVADVDATTDPWWSDHTWTTTLKIAGKTLGVVRDKAGTVTATVNGTANADLKPTAVLDTANNLVLVTLPKANLEKVLGAPLAPGTAITDTAIATAVSAQMIGEQSADSAAGTKDTEKTYAYGDNTCFKPPAGKLALDADPRGQYTDATMLFATLTDADDAPVQGATVTASLSGDTVASAVTDADGVAEIALPIDVPAGSKSLTVAFAGTTEVGAVSMTQSFGVLAEKTVLKASGLRGGAKAVLSDDDRHPVAGQVVTFTVGSKKYSVRTSTKGVAVLSRIAKGAVIKVGYAGSKNYFLATPTYTVKAG